MGACQVQKCPRKETYMGYEIKKGKTESSSPETDKYVCSICGLVYDPEIGDPKHGIEPGTAFDDLPDTWKCPVCGAKTEYFMLKEE